MQSLILTLHIVVCVLLVILILLQAGKEGMGVIFGGGNSSVFGSTGAGGILVKLTTLMALIFVVTSLSYTYVTSSHQEKESTILDVKIEDQPVAPVEVSKKEAGQAAEPAANNSAPKDEAAKNEAAIKPNDPAKETTSEALKAKEQTKAEPSLKEKPKAEPNNEPKAAEQAKEKAKENQEAPAEQAKNPNEPKK